MCSTASSISTGFLRRSRTKTRKPKFLSLRREFSPESENSIGGQHHQLNLFPLHPENLFQEKEIHDNVDYLLDEEVHGGAGATLTGLLDGGGGASSEEEERDEGSVSLSPSSLTCACGAAQERDGGNELARAALRHRERDTSEEKWVAYSDVATKECGYRAPGLSLKLDYQEILNAWSDKAPLYIDGGCEGPQIVPDHDDNPHIPAEVGGTGLGRLWNVPDKVSGGGGVVTEEGGGTMGQREASVLRYKEKRQSRLFSKRIRYEVRKLNAEKRPRMKGRFVKRKPED